VQLCPNKEPPPTVIKNLCRDTTVEKLAKFCGSKGVNFTEVFITRRKKVIVKLSSSDTDTEICKLHEHELDGTKLDVAVSNEPYYALKHVRNNCNNLLNKRQWSCVSLIVGTQEGRPVVWTPPANFELFPDYSHSFADPLTNQRYHLCLDQAKTYACLAFIFLHREKFIQNRLAMQLWDLPFCEEPTAASYSFDEENEGFPAALHNVESWKAYSIPSMLIKKNQETPTPTLVAVRLRQGAIVHYMVNPFKDLIRCSRYHLSRPFPYIIEPNTATESGQSPVLQKTYFTGIIGHSLQSPIEVTIHVLGTRREPRQMKLQELIKHCPKTCFDYAMRKELHRTPGFVSLLGRNLQCGEYGAVEGSTRKPTWKEYGAPGCTKCRETGCKDCFQARYGPIQDDTTSERHFFRL